MGLAPRERGRSSIVAGLRWLREDSGALESKTLLASTLQGTAIRPPCRNRKSTPKPRLALADYRGRDHRSAIRQAARQSVSARRIDDIRLRQTLRRCGATHLASANENLFKILVSPNSGILSRPPENETPLKSCSVRTWYRPEIQRFIGLNFDFAST
jgi:hypothetical protein